MDYVQDGEIFIGAEGFVRVLEFRRGPENYFDLALVRNLGAVIARLDDDPDCRAILLCSEGRVFCAGASYAAMQGDVRHEDLIALYDAAGMLFRANKPIVAAIQGAAVGGGLGLAVAADFRVASPEARFSANFSRIGIHPGFGLSVTLPHLIGFQRASLMIQTGRRVKADEALRWGLADDVVPAEALRAAAMALAQEIAEGAPLAVQAARATLRVDLAAIVAERVKLEAAEQMRLYATRDFAEGVRAVQERRKGAFAGR